MKKLPGWLIPFLLFVCATQSSSATNPAARLVLTHVTVIDATGAPAKSDMSVTIVNGRISQIAKTSKTHPAHDAQVIDASGKFLIPGLWDMHTHWGETDYLPLFLANGVTGLRIMWRSEEHTSELQSHHDIV